MGDAAVAVLELAAPRVLGLRRLPDEPPPAGLILELIVNFLVAFHRIIGDRNISVRY